MVKNGENFYGESGREIGKFLHFSPFFTMNTSPLKCPEKLFHPLKKAFGTFYVFMRI